MSWCTSGVGLQVLPCIDNSHLGSIHRFQRFSFLNIKMYLSSCVYSFFHQKYQIHAVTQRVQKYKTSFKSLILTGFCSFEWDTFYLWMHLFDHFSASLPLSFLLLQLKEEILVLEDSNRECKLKQKQAEDGLKMEMERQSELSTR